MRWPRPGTSCASGLARDAGGAGRPQARDRGAAACGAPSCSCAATRSPPGASRPTSTTSSRARSWAATSFLVNHPDGIRRVLVDNHANYGRTPATIRILRPILGDGLFLAEGNAWKHQRRTMAPAFAPRSLDVAAAPHRPGRRGDGGRASPRAAPAPSISCASCSAPPWRSPAARSSRRAWPSTAPPCAPPSSATAPRSRAPPSSTSCCRPRRRARSTPPAGGSRATSSACSTG